MHLSDQALIVILVVGIVAGWLAGKIVRGNGFGLVGDAVPRRRRGAHRRLAPASPRGSSGSGVIGLTINATIGAIVLLLVLRLVGASGWGGR